MNQNPLPSYGRLLAETLVLALMVSFRWPVETRAAQWNQFRGPNGQGVEADAQPPTRFGPKEKLLWKAEIGPGHSSPVLWDTRIFATSVQTQALETLCFDRKDGKQLWRKTVNVPKFQKTHRMSNPAVSTPAVDADRVYVLFGSAGLYCYDHAGKEIWHRDLTPAKNKYGTASSPILHGGHVIVLLDADDGTSRVMALQSTTGETVWETPRPLFQASWTTPMIWREGENERIVALGSGRLTAYDPANGKEIWWAGGFPPETINVPVAGDGLLFASSATLGGRGDPKYDVNRSWLAIRSFDKNGDGKIQREEMTKGFAIPLRLDLPADNPGYAFPNSNSDALLSGFDQDGDRAISEAEWKSNLSDFVNLQPTLIAVRNSAKGDARPKDIAWEIHRHIPEIPSPLFYRKRLYLVSDGGLATCLEATSGKELYSERLNAPGQYAASPVAANGHIYLVSVNGIVSVLEAGDTFRILERNELGESVYATPALMEKQIYLRTTQHLFAFGE